MNKMLLALVALLSVVCGCFVSDPASDPVDDNMGQVAQAVGQLEPDDQFLANATIGIHRVRGSGLIAWANQADYMALGYSTAEWVGHDIREFHVSQATIESWLVTLGSGGTLVNAKARLYRHDGSMACVLVQSSYSSEWDSTRCFTAIQPMDVCDDQ